VEEVVNEEVNEEVQEVEEQRLISRRIYSSICMRIRSMK
jgi:hypothetical protein